MRTAFTRHDPLMTGAELMELAADLGIDAIGAIPVAPYDDTERHIRERRSRGLFADMRFTMARPDVSCHPETLLEGARTVVAAALCYYRDGPPPAADDGVLPRYTWHDEYAELRTRLDALGRRLGGSYRVLVDENAHVDRAAAVRAGVAFYGKNTMAITRRHGSWVVLGVLVTDVEIDTTPALELDCGECTLCIDACPTGALNEPGTLDATKCLSYWTQAPTAIPEEYREELGAMVYGDELVADLDRLYVPRNESRWLRRNALVAAGNVGTSELEPSVRRYAEDQDPILRDAAEWALARIADRRE